jgi:hypothetical protein
MNVLVLTAGRTGSLTFAEACRHITNYTTGHETRVGLLGADRLAYPDQHIEVDDRLAWFPGRLEETFGNGAFYVHLVRDQRAVAASRMRRWNKPGMRSYRDGILWDVDPSVSREDIALDFVRTVDSNIEHFLRDKTQTMRIDIETAAQTFPEFWERIGAEGDLEAALRELEVHHHEGTQRRSTPRTDDGHDGAGQPGEPDVDAPHQAPRSWLARRLRRPS